MIPLFDPRMLTVQVNLHQRNQPIRQFGTVAVDPFTPTLNEALKEYFIITIPTPYSGGAGKRSFIYKGLYGLHNIPLGQGPALVGWALVRRLYASTDPDLDAKRFLHWAENTKEGETARRMYQNIVRDPMGKTEIEIIRLNKKTAELQKKIAEILPGRLKGSVNKERDVIKKIQTFLRKPQAKSFLKKEFVKQDAHPYTGHCYVASQVLYDVLGGDNAGYEVYQMDHEGVSHWFLKNKAGTVLDPTVLQFETKPDYAEATHSAFLWTEDGLSKRAQEMKEQIF